MNIQKLLDRYSLTTRAQGDSEDTIKHIRRFVGFFSWLEREGVIKTDPLLSVPAPKLPERRPKVMTEKEMTRIEVDHWTCRQQLARMCDNCTR